MRKIILISILSFAFLACKKNKENKIYEVNHVNGGKSTWYLKEYTKNKIIFIEDQWQWNEKTYTFFKNGNDIKGAGQIVYEETFHPTNSPPYTITTKWRCEYTGTIKHQIIKCNSLYYLESSNGDSSTSSGTIEINLSKPIKQ